MPISFVWDTCILAIVFPQSSPGEFQVQSEMRITVPEALLFRGILPPHPAGSWIEFDWHQVTSNLDQPGATLQPASITLSGVSSTFTSDSPLCASHISIGLEESIQR